MITIQMTLLLLLLLLFLVQSSGDFSEFFLDQRVSEDLRTILSHEPINIAEKNYPGGKIIVSFVNGIYHSTEDWRRISENLLEIFREAVAIDEHGKVHDKNHNETREQLRFDVEVRPFYNPSTGWWVGDLTQAASALIKRPSDHSTALKLAEHLRRCLADSQNGRILHLAHSGGAIITYLAAKYHLSVEERSRIDVVTFGGGRSITGNCWR